MHQWFVSFFRGKDLWLVAGFACSDLYGSWRGTAEAYAANFQRGIKHAYQRRQVLTQRRLRTWRPTGGRSRATIYEICVVNENLHRLMIRKETGNVLEQRATLDGMETLRQNVGGAFCWGRRPSRKHSA